jgi:hypothetical protein
LPLKPKVERGSPNLQASFADRTASLRLQLDCKQEMWGSWDEGLVYQIGFSDAI